LIWEWSEGEPAPTVEVQGVMTGSPEAAIKVFQK